MIRSWIQCLIPSCSGAPICNGLAGLGSLHSRCPCQQHGIIPPKILRNDSSRDESLTPSVRAEILWKIYAGLTLCHWPIPVQWTFPLGTLSPLHYPRSRPGDSSSSMADCAYYDNTLGTVYARDDSPRPPVQMYFLIPKPLLSLFGDEQVKIFFLILVIGTAVRPMT